MQYFRLKKIENEVTVVRAGRATRRECEAHFYRAQCKHFHLHFPVAAFAFISLRDVTTHTRGDRAITQLFSLRWQNVVYNKYNKRLNSHHFYESLAVMFELRTDHILCNNVWVL